MNSFRPILLSPEEIEVLRGKLLSLDSVVPILSKPKLTSLISALGIHQEVGTINDELSRFIFDISGNPVPLESLRSEMIEYRGFIGVRIWAIGYEHLDFRLKGMRELMHPFFSFHEDGSIKQCVLFPESVAKIVKLQGAELVLVREWAMNTIFGGFDRSKRFYETNAWELVHNDAVRYSGLLENQQIAFLGTHDLAAHISGIHESAITHLKSLGAETKKRFNSYFGLMKKPSIYTLVLPYAAGVILDDLAQPANYSSSGRRFVFDRIMAALEQKIIDPSIPKILARFPLAYEKLINLARNQDFDLIQKTADSLCLELIHELRMNVI